MTRIMITMLFLLLSVAGTGCAQRAVSLSPAEVELAKAIGFAEPVLARAKSLGKGDLSRLVGTDEETADARPLDGFTFPVALKEVPRVVAGLRKELGPLGFLVFRSQSNFGLDGQPDRVAVLRGSDQFAILKGMGTNGANYDIGNDAVIAKLKEWDARFGLVVTGAEFDWVEAEFVKGPADMPSFAAEVYSFCPDVVDQGTGDLKKLAEEMKKTNSLYLWWD